MRKTFGVSCVGVLLMSAVAFGQANGKLQIHYMDVDQGDGAILISPQGETVLFDNGDFRSCRKPVKYLEKIGVTKIDYMIISHYHADHYGCTKPVLDKFPLTTASFDRPGNRNGVDMFDKYVAAVGTKRRSVSVGQVIELDQNSQAPVRIKIVAVNGAGVNGADDENDRSVVAVVNFGKLDVMMAGDLSGEDTDRYRDVETTIAGMVGQMEVYKVNHHGSSHSSNVTFLARIKPRIAIISAGKPNTHGHPTKSALKRIRDAGIEKTYWTSRGSGGRPRSGKDIVVRGPILLEMAPNAETFTIKYRNKTNTHNAWPDQ